jgi:hypothetical protein
MRHTIIISLIILTFLFGCKNKQTVGIEYILKEWVDKTVIMPNIKPVYMSKRDTVKYVIDTTRQYSILIYTDSTGCTDCKLRLHVWKTYIGELPHVNFMFYFHPKNEQHLSSLLRQAFFNYPVYLDRNDDLNKLNHFPDNPIFQCFLLDNDNKIISMGNPVLNPKIWELYKRIITGKISDKTPETAVEAAQTEIELQDLKVGKTSEAIFVLKNTGTKPLVIQMVDASCGCTVPEWEKQPVAAGKSTEIRVKITPEKSEYFDKMVTVHCNTEESRIMFHIRGTVEEG